MPCADGFQDRYAIERPDISNLAKNLNEIRIRLQSK
jgi:hypothetical protein